MSVRASFIKIPLLLLSSVMFCSCTSRKTGYVDTFRLVNAFELQKEYSGQAKREMEHEKMRIDSIIAVEAVKNPSGKEQYQRELYTPYNKKAQDLNKEIEAMIWKRLNPYLVDFGKDRGYLYIYGANGTGNVLYADKGEDITEEIIKYANNRYHDKK